MSSYGFLADSYDALTEDVRYSRWADYLQRHFRRAGRPVETVLDLACGTGSLTWELAERGYRVTGVDRSPDMLAVAWDKCGELDPPPLLVCQDMARLKLAEGVDACVCCLDSVNYVTRPQSLRSAFSRVYQALNPGGIFLFDIRTPAALAAVDGQVFLDEDEDVYCVWRGSYSPRRRLCTYGMDIFRREADGRWSRGEEVHEEYAYEPEELEAYLKEAGFSAVKQYGPLKMRPPTPEDQRIFFVSRKETQ